MLHPDFLGASPYLTPSFFGYSFFLCGRWPVAGGWWPGTGGRWPVAGGRGPGAGGRWPVAGGRWPVAGDRWPVAGGRWPVAGGRRVVAGGWLPGKLRRENVARAMCLAANKLAKKAED